MLFHLKMAPLEPSLENSHCRKVRTLGAAYSSGVRQDDPELYTTQATSGASTALRSRRSYWVRCEARVGHGSTWLSITKACLQQRYGMVQHKTPQSYIIHKSARDLQGRSWRSFTQNRFSRVHFPTPFRVTKRCCTARRKDQLTDR